MPASNPRDARKIHPTLTAADRRRLFLRGVELFNAGRFYDCHDAFEEIWRSTTPEPRDLFQGLIQVAVAMHHHLERGKPAVARRVMGKGLERLRSLDGTSHGLDLSGLVESAARWRAYLARVVGGGADFAGEPPEVPRIVVVDRDAVR